MNRNLMLLLCIFMNAAVLFAMDLPLGTSTAELGLKTAEDAEEYFGKGLPLGPASLRFYGSSLWVSDSLNKRFVEFDSEGRLIKSISIATENHIYPEDFVMLPDGGFWVCDIDNTAVLRLDAAGKVVRQFNTIGDKKLAWPFRIELLPSGNLLVLDVTLAELIEFSDDGTFVRADPVYGRSFLVEKDSVVYIVEKEQRFHLLVRKLTDGKETSNPIPLGDVLDAELLAKTAAGEYVVGFKAIRSAAGSGETLPYFLMRFMPGSDKPFVSMQIGFPEPFLTRPLISNGAGKDFLIRLAPAGPGKVLRLDPVLLNFSLEASDG